MKNLKKILKLIRDDLSAHHPRTVLLFGSAARYLHKIQEEEPEDFDIFYVAPFTPALSETIPVDVDMHCYTEYELIRIARSLRYSPKFLSRAKMYMQDTWHATLRSDIAACLLLGPSYQDYGFLQMENEETFRDYSIHEVLLGKKWWQSIQAWTQKYRGPKGLFFDKALGNDRFRSEA